MNRPIQEWEKKRFKNNEKDSKDHDKISFLLKNLNMNDEVKYSKIDYMPIAEKIRKHLFFKKIKITSIFISLYTIIFNIFMFSFESDPGIIRGVLNNFLVFIFTLYIKEFFKLVTGVLNIIYNINTAYYIIFPVVFFIMFLVSIKKLRSNE